ncbi:hypothetical protein [Bradyrhizobium sp. STM 3557]|uniref:hypothetical protein n=1 Tax=Bradyrhizobium sp. STM 3557 TaxID=578920 RepID=UPI003890006D
MSNIIDFRSASARLVSPVSTESAEPIPSRSTLRKPYERGGPSMHTFAFRSYDMILESDDTDLVRDVRLDIHKARVKLRKIQERLQGVREQAAAKIQVLTEAENKLSVAIEAAVADQLASGVKAAPPKRKAEQERREFREAMRRRIRKVAAILKLSEEQIEWPLTLRHREIGRFCLKHGVQAEWLFEGRGRIFKDDAIEVGPNMTGAEFAEVVTTLPMADRRAIEAKLRQLAEGRQR